MPQPELGRSDATQQQLPHKRMPPTVWMEEGERFRETQAWIEEKTAH